jgi:hypothetical protein
MALPKITHPMFDVVIPSTKTKIKIRPMLVKEEKILLMAKNGEEETEILSAVKQVVNNCIVTDGIDVDKLALFDVEYLFVKIRAVSVSNVSKVSYKDNEDEKIYDFEVDLDKVEVKFPTKIEKNIAISDTSGIIMKYPEAALYSDTEFLKLPPEQIIDSLILHCIDKIYDGDEMFDPKSFKKSELNDFIEQLDVNTYDKLRQFFTNIPNLYYQIEYTNLNGNKREIVLTALTDFFTLR